MAKRQYQDLFRYFASIRGQEYPYSDRGLTYYNNPLQTEYSRQTLSDFQRNKMLDDHIDYLMNS